MKQILFICLLQLLVYAAYGQFTISGKIVDETGNPLPGANIILENTYHGTSTDLKGNFVFSKIRKGEYVLKITYIGYASVQKMVKVDANVYLDISLEPAMILGDEVIISATRASDKAPVAFTNMEKDVINERNIGQDIPYLLSLTPSFVTSSDAGAGVGYTSFRIRGTDLNRINVTVNGIPLNDSESHGVWWVDLPDFASSVENVQIQRGVGTSTNGAGAFGATVNFQTFTLQKEPYAEINSSVGSFDTYKNTISLGSGIINGKFTFDGRLSKISSNGFIDRASSDLKSFAVSGAYYQKNTILKVIVFSGKEKTYQAWDGVPGYLLSSNRTFNGIGEYKDANGNTGYYANETDNYQQDHFQVFYSTELNPHLHLNTAFHYTKGKGYYEQYKESQEFSKYGLDNLIVGSDTLTDTDLIRQKWLDNDFYGVTYSLKYQGKKWDAVLGGAWNNYLGDHFGKVIWARFVSNSDIDHEWYNNNGAKKDFNVFGKTNYQINSKLNLYGDLQYRRIHYEIKGIDDDFRDITQRHEFDFFNPKVGFSYIINDRQSLYYSFGIAHREPNRYNFIDADPNGPIPSPETLRDYEFGYSFKSAHYLLVANVYYMNYKNQLVLTGEINDVGSPIMTNVDKSYRAGLEITTGINILPKLNWEANVTFSRNRIIGFTEYIDDWDTWSQVSNYLGETDLSFSPNIIAGSKINYEMIKKVNVALISKYVGDQYIDNTSSEDRKLDRYFINNLYINYRHKSSLFKEINFTLLVNNLFNVEYETNAWVYRYLEGGEKKVFDGYFPQAGINYLLGLSVKF
ncbi:MAG: TonB-dependent receptor plug domain-containing protein [Bacteroidetes bacterium]|nr:TonB-dependent receptor plug domain-containing protein [Bacteroidota bacterium]